MTGKDGNRAFQEGTAVGTKAALKELGPMAVKNPLFHKSVLGK